MENASIAEAIAHYETKLAFSTDPADLHDAMERGDASFILIDARKRHSFVAAHIPGAINIPHREMTPESTAALDRAKTIVVYCDGIGCNASIRGALRMSQLGFRAIELLGGIDWWQRDGFDVHGAASDAQPARAGASCGC